MRIVLADRHKGVLSALQLVLWARHRGWEITAVSNLDALLETVQAGPLGVLVVDWDLAPTSQRMRVLLEQVRRPCPQASVLVTGTSPETAAPAAQAGADAFACKSDPPEAVLSIIDRLAAAARRS